MKLSRENLEDLHTIMSNGKISQCRDFQIQSKCTCCVFDSGLGNWIGLLPGEREYLESTGDISLWEFIEKGSTEGVICKRNGFACLTEPLDCKLYPYFPANVVPLGEDKYRVTLIAGFPKCPLHTDITFISSDDHANKVALIGVLLYKSGFLTWMQDTASGFKGYNEKVHIVVSA